MSTVKFAYGDSYIEHTFEESRFLGELVSEMHHYEPVDTPYNIVKKSLENPIGTPTLAMMSEGKNQVVIIDSDHTRPVPSKIIIPQILAEIRKGNPDADITILISTGTHRATTTEELISKFGKEIVDSEKIVVHDADNSPLVYMGKLPSGGELHVNKLAVDADLLIGVGFIEPHFFAGFSGGRKSLMPGVAKRETVMYNHNAEFINHPKARTGVLEGNPIHEDMLYAARCVNMNFICNVVINSDKDAIFCVSGDLDLAHKVGREFLASKCQVKSVNADIAISTNGGYPLDQNIYQAVKGMTAAEATVKEGGVIIMLARSNDGHGGDEFHKMFAEERNVDVLMNRFLSTPKEKTPQDQWQSQIFARVLKRATVIYVSEAPAVMVEDLHMIPAATLEEAIAKAEEILGNNNASIVAIPDGVGVMVV